LNNSYRKSGLDLRRLAAAQFSITVSHSGELDKAIFMDDITDRAAQSATARQ
jgi:hypothetical protein